MSEFRYLSITDLSFNLPIAPLHAAAKTEEPGLSDNPTTELNIPYTVFEILVAIVSIIGNVLVIIVFRRERKLRRRTNYYIVSLAMADFLVGSLGVPFAILASIGLPHNLHACLFTVSLLVVLCTISIFCLVAVSVDRYWAILYPMAYSRNVRTRTAIFIISMCWVAGTIVGFLPLFGWHADVAHNQECLFVEVMDYDYLVFLYFATIITPALLMLAFYTHIYRVIIKQVRQIVTMNPASDLSRRSSTAPMQVMPGRGGHAGTMLRVLGAARKRDVKATQNLSIIVLFFMICWIPLYTINCIKAFCPDCYVHPKLTLFCIILSHLNSAVNPVLYAYHLKDFRAALKNLLLKMMGVDIDQQAEATHRFSLASQHRLQSMDSNMRSTQPRLYVGEYSPIWLRQQQEALKNSQLLPKCGVVSPCFNNINQTVAAVASVTTEMEREMWNIMEASSGAELGEISYEFPIPAGLSPKRESDHDSSISIPPRTSPDKPASLQPATHGMHQRCDSVYSYDNHNYSSSQDEDDKGLVDEDGDDIDFEDVFDPGTPNQTGVDPAELRRSLAIVMREKLRSDDTDYQNQPSNIHELPYDLDLALQQEGAKGRPCSTQTSPTNGPLPPLLRAKLFAGNSNSLPGTSHKEGNTPTPSVYVIDSEASPGSTGHKPKYRKGTALTRNSLKKSRSCTCSNNPKGRSQGDGNGEVALSLNNNNNLSDPQESPLNHHQESFFSPLRSVSSLMHHSNLFHLFQPHATRTTSTSTNSPGPSTPTPAHLLARDEAPSASSPSLATASAES
ncbi:D(1C) dopamine receptor isoform X1 [Drosophila miranda]|uniref:D(1C) dopamine receptor isoform X1 n=1 Tax=Drosophila miranda TaxID=7229 RepID=UPI0007E69B91|nr:D(1C) dopamine receptor isoform X1 [Drosophila miranda]XP_017142731.1 D(1C) dopamine receptor isoform X1 [Drosophila miranda]